MTSATRAWGAPEEQGRLRQLIWFDVATCCTAVTWMSATYTFIAREGWLLVLSALVALAGVVMAAGLRPLAAGDLAAAVTYLAVANWAIALAATSIATFAWPLMVLAALLPAVFAAPYVAGPRLRVMGAVSVAVSVGVAALGLLQDLSGFTDDLPEWVPRAVVIFFTPFMAGLILTTALQHSRRLQDALAETEAANAALRASQSRLVAATDRERRRVERDLHDGVQQRLVALGLRLRLTRDLIGSDGPAAIEAIEQSRNEVHAVHEELRALAHGVYPPVLTQHGLAEALPAAADRCPLPVELDLTSLGRYSAEVEATVYFCCAEALQNAAKHAGTDARVRLSVAEVDHHLVFEVHDDGSGFDPAGVQPHGGLDNLRDRVGAHDGALAVHTGPGRGTAIRGRVPVIGTQPNGTR